VGANGAGAVTAAVARDLGDALAAIADRAHLLLRRLPEDETLRQPAREILDTAGRASAGVGRLLSQAQGRAPKPLDLELNAVVRQMQAPLQRLVGDGIRVDVELDPRAGSWLVKADPAQIQRAILNLILNARDALAGGGRIVIGTSTATGEPGRIELTVRDDGSGMDDATRSRALQPFFTTKGAGRGLGLFVVQGIVEQCGGRVEVESEPQRGTVVRLLLPASPPAPGQEGDEPRAAVLLVVVDDDLRNVLAAMLDVGGYAVIAAANGAEALRLLEQHAGPVALMVTETVLPGISGRELARRVGDARPDTRLLYLSSYVEEPWLRSEKRPFLSLPLSTDALLRGVRHALAGNGEAGERRR
jgi:CheY-like chemotaxis protein